jgi:hypothetical protein
LNDKHKIHIQLDERACEDAGVSIETPITLKASNLTLRAALWKILAPLGLTWTVANELVSITTPEEADYQLLTRVYAVDDLPDAALPLELDQTGRGACSLVSSDAVRALVVTGCYAVQEETAATLEAIRTIGRRGAEGKTESPRTVVSMLPGEEPILKALGEKTWLDFQQQPLSEVLDFIEGVHKINVQLDRHALEESKIDPAKPVTIKVSGVPLREALKELLGPLELTWTFAHESLVVTTPDAAKQNLVTKVYAADGLPDSALPKESPSKQEGTACKLVSTETLRALVVTDSYAVQEELAAKLAALRKEAKKTE